ncbi:Putative SANT/Myb domain, Homeobox-like domain superfamily protein [Septoria linicola]|uniref:SANT/Myb domain, Homeobox-like domain superfamily protein n=1 Tax=Septoria linicola TaxID=215465 RepID=A0A9Q9ARJ1_9PEZI|nr:putative SANT/Myb domain, Homeobox-like domain superfamily protein [Septoria linicola]USW50736.1 Putative SANT/Myb domain, Homeobox-like domain superfamily protein [Septoria linicola]
MRLTFDRAQWLPVARISYKRARCAQHRWQSTLATSTPSLVPKKLGWSQLEENKLSDFVESGRRDWSHMARELGRTTDSVRAHYRNRLQPRTGIRANVGRNAGLRMTQSEVSHMFALAQKGYEIGAIAKIMQRHPRTISTRLKSSTEVPADVWSTADIQHALDLKSQGKSYVEIAEVLRTIPSKARTRLTWHTRQATLSTSFENRRVVCELRDQGKSIAQIGAQTGLKLAVVTRYANVPDEHTKLTAPGPARKWTREDISSLTEMYNAGSPLKEIAQRLQRSFSSIQHAVRRAEEGAKFYDSVSPARVSSPTRCLILS